MKLPSPARSAFFRLVLSYLALFCLAVAGVFGFVYHFSSGYMRSQIDETIAAEVKGLAEQYAQAGLAGLVRVVEARSLPGQGGEGLYLLAGPGFEPLAGNVASWPRGPAGELPIEGLLDVHLSGPRGELPGHVRLYLLPGGFHLLVGRDSAELKKLDSLLLSSLGWGLGLTALFGALYALYISRWALLRLENVNRAAKRIMEGDLGERVDEPRDPAKGDEFDALARNFNEMLDRIEALMDGVRQVSDNIAHDLRGPLTRLRSRLELGLGQDLNQAEAKLLLEQAIAELDEILRTFSALLTISQAEAGVRRGNFQDFDLAETAAKVCDLYEPLAEDKDIELERALASGARIFGDPRLVAQALANLLDNALKFAPQGGKIQVRVSLGTEETRLEVIDNGPGIPESERESVLGRFVRLEASRNTPGSGLGLSLVAAVARLHRARLELAGAGPGLQVAVNFPKSLER